MQCVLTGLVDDGDAALAKTYDSSVLLFVIIKAAGHCLSIAIVQRLGHVHGDEPRFANELTGDLHLQSVAGRWSQYFYDLGMDPWDFGDTNTSPIVDLGNPWIGAGAESSLPWGYRLNLGA